MRFDFSLVAYLFTASCYHFATKCRLTAIDRLKVGVFKHVAVHIDGDVDRKMAHERGHGFQFHARRKVAPERVPQIVKPDSLNWARLSAGQVQQLRLAQPGFYRWDDSDPLRLLSCS